MQWLGPGRAASNLAPSWRGWCGVSCCFAHAAHLSPTPLSPFGGVEFPAPPRSPGNGAGRRQPRRHTPHTTRRQPLSTFTLVLSLAAGPLTMPTPRSTLPTPASSRKPSASEQRVRRIAKEVEDNSFKFSQQPNFGSATVHPRVPRLADLKLLDAGSQSTRSATLPARATASSARAHGIWDRSSILTGMPGWAAEPGSCAGGAEDAEASGLGSKTGAVAAEPKRGMSEPVRVEPPNSWGTPVLVAPTGGSLTARLGASRPGTASQHGGGASARPSSARGGGGGGGGGSARGDKSLQDYAVLAAACRRVGRHRQEALVRRTPDRLHTPPWLERRAAPATRPLTPSSSGRATAGALQLGRPARAGGRHRARRRLLPEDARRVRSWKGAPPCLPTAPHLPLWLIGRLGPRLHAPGRHASRLEARRDPPQPAPGASPWSRALLPRPSAQAPRARAAT